MRKFFFAFLIIALLTLSGAVVAQDAVDPCAGLSPEDCAIITASEEVMATLSSATFDFSLNIDVLDEAQPLQLAINGDGAFSGAAMDMAMDMTAIDPNDPMAALEAIGPVLTAFSGELNLSILLPPEAAAEVPFSSIDLNLLLVDGVGYLNFGTIAPLLGGEAALQQMGLPTGWAGLDLIATFEELAAFAGSMEMPETEEGADMAEQMDPMAFADLGAGYVTVTRLDDSPEGAAVFETTVDLGALAADPEFSALIIEQVEAQGTPLTEEDRAQLESQLPALMDAIDVVVTQSIDQSTFFQTSLAVNVAIDGPALDAVMAAAGETSTEPTPNIGVTVLVTYDDFNAAPEIAAPADAPVATFSDLFGLLMMAGSMEQ